MMRRLLAFEWLHWSTRRDVRIAVGGLMLGSLLWSWLAALAVESSLIPGFLSGSDATGFAILYRSMRGLSALLALLMLLWSASSVAADFETGQLRAQLLRVRRSELLLSKALHLWLVAAALLGLSLLLCGIVGAVAFGLAPVKIGPLTVHSLGSLLRSGFSAYLLTVLPLASCIALGVTISALSSNSRAATMLTLFAVAGVWTLGQIGSLSSLDFVSAISRPWNVALAHAEGLRTVSHRDALMPLILSNLAWTATCLRLATWRFRRRDLR